MAEQPAPTSSDEKKVAEISATGKVQISIPDATIAPVDIKTAEIATINLTGKLEAPAPSVGFFSGVKMTQSKFSGDPVFTLEYDMIDAPTERDYRENRAKVALKWAKSRSYMFKPTSELEPMYKEADATVDSQIGFPIHSEVMRLAAPNRKRVALTYLRGIRDDPVTNPRDRPYAKLATFVGTVAERNFMIAMDAIARRRFAEVADLRNFFEPMADMFTRVDAMGQIDTRKRKFYRPGPQNALQQWLSDNFITRVPMFEAILNYVRREVALKVQASDATFRQFLQILGMQNNQARAVTDYPARLSSTAGRKTGELLFAIQVANNLARIQIDVPMDDVSLGTLMQCLLAKLLLSKDQVTEGTILDVDNYLARWLVPALPGYTQVNDPLIGHFSEARLRQRNFLTEQYRRNVIANVAMQGGDGVPAQRGINHTAIWDFLLTTPAGGGWASAGNALDVPLPAVAVPYLNNRTKWYAMPFGEELPTHTAVPEQFKRLSRFLRIALSRRVEIASPQERIGQSIVKLLQWLESKELAFGSFVFYMQRVVPKLAYNSLIMPDLKVPAHLLDPITLPPDGLMSFIAYGEFDHRTDVKVPFDLIHGAWKVHEDFQSLVDHFHFFADRLTDKSYSRKDYLKFALAHTSDSTGFIKYLSEQLLTEGMFASAVMPDRGYVSQDFTDRIKLAEDFIDEHLGAFGVRRAFYFDPAPERISDDTFQRRLRPGSAVLRTVTRREVEDLVGEEKFVALLREARAKGKLIKFDMPVNFKRAEVEKWVAHEVPLSLPSGSRYFTVKPIVMDYTFSDVVINDDINDMLLAKDSEWLVSDEDFVATDESYIASLISHIQVDKEPITFDTVVNFAVRR
jgi:hypothetical protein